jgi:hypothetical protein
MSAAGTAAPFWSATLPEIVPVIVWPLAGGLKKTAANRQMIIMDQRRDLLNGKVRSNEILCLKLDMAISFCGGLVSKRGLRLANPKLDFLINADQIGLRPSLPCRFENLID